MNLKEIVNRKIIMKAYERNFIIAITLLATLLLANIWPRFKADAFEFPWYAYVALIILFSIPLIINNKKRREK